jgi:Zn-dependent M28 family amino/carboxypeptidase
VSAGAGSEGAGGAPARRAERLPAEIRWALAAVPFALVVFAWAWMIRMPGDSYSGPRQRLDSELDSLRRRLAAHVATLAGDIGERNYRLKDALDRAAGYVEAQLAALGYSVTSLPFSARGGLFRNLEATLPGTTRADEIVLVGAHYDTAEGAPGADDNASGTAALLELARVLRSARLERTVRFVAFTNEEPPFFNGDSMGSRLYADLAALRGDRIVAMFSLETVGHYSNERHSQRYPFPFNLFYPDRGNFIAFVGNLASRPLVRRSLGTFRRNALLASEGVASPSWMPGVFWSDHASFWRHGVPAVMITDTAPFRYRFYHTELDTPDRLDYSRMARVVDGVAQVVATLALPAS